MRQLSDHNLQYELTLSQIMRILPKFTTEFECMQLVLFFNAYNCF